MARHLFTASLTRSASEHLTIGLSTRLVRSHAVLPDADTGIDGTMSDPHARSAVCRGVCDWSALLRRAESVGFSLSYRTTDTGQNGLGMVSR